MFLQAFSQPLYYLIVFCGLILALTIHEASHAFLANRLGDATAKAAGRLTLNPLAHLDLMGTLMLLLFRFGWGKPVPVNPLNFKNPRLDNFKVALAGPLSNLAVAVLLAAIKRLIGLPSSVLDIFILVNLILAVFNILPIPPLDGSKVLGIFLSPGAYFEIERLGPYILLAFLFVSFVGVFPLFDWLSGAVNAIFTILTGGSIF